MALTIIICIVLAQALFLWTSLQETIKKGTINSTYKKKLQWWMTIDMIGISICLAAFPIYSFWFSPAEPVFWFCLDYNEENVFVFGQTFPRENADTLLMFGTIAGAVGGKLQLFSFFKIQEARSMVKLLSGKTEE